MRLSAPGKTQFVFDLVVGQAIGDTVALSLNADYWKNDTASWVGAGLKAKITLADNFYIVPRVEFISSKSGGYVADSGFGLDAMGMVPANLADVTLYEGTLTAAFPVKKNYEIRAELRADASNKDAFSKGSTPEKSQVTGLIGILAWLP